jgi:hypothetical protein
MFVSPLKWRFLRWKPYQVCNITAKNNFGRCQDVFFISLMPKKTYAFFQRAAIVGWLDPVNTDA